MIEELFALISHKMLYYYHNKGFRLWGYKLNSFRDRYIQGFYKDNYAEFGIDTQLEINVNKLICSFNIADVEVKISHPSDFYKLIFQSIKPFNTFRVGWDDDITISFKRKNKARLKVDDIEKYLQQALFILNINYPDVFVFGNSNNEYKRGDIEYKKKYIGEISDINDIEPVVYFNEAINSTEETAFYYFYKVIEYYYKINIECLIKEKIILSKVEDNLAASVKKIIKINTNNKETKLIYLLSNTAITSSILDIFNSYFCESKKIGEYAKLLYKRRNQLFHSEDSNRYLPKLLVMPQFDNNDLTVADWNKLIREISIVCINYFSYGNSLNYQIN
jgi:hypothetical protein